MCVPLNLVTWVWASESSWWKESINSWKLSSVSFTVWLTCPAPLTYKASRQEATCILLPPWINALILKKKTRLNLRAIGKWSLNLNWYNLGDIYLIQREPCKFGLKTFIFPPASTNHGSSVSLAIDSRPWEHHFKKQSPQLVCVPMSICVTKHTCGGWRTAWEESVPVLCRSWGLNSGGQARKQVPLPTEPSLWPWIPFFDAAHGDVSHGDIITVWQNVPTDKWRSGKVTCWGNSRVETRSHHSHPWFSALSNTSLLPAVRWRENQMVWQTVLVAVKSVFLSALTGSSYLPCFGRGQWWKRRQVEAGKQSARFFMWHKCPISSRSPSPRKKQGKGNE